MKLALFVFFVVGLSHAEILRVPSEYSTISAALSVLHNGDTVIVDPGVYVEALRPPALSFSLFGSNRLDSTATNSTIIDPALLPRSDTLRCLTIRGGSVIIEDIVFRNGAAMREGRNSNAVGGIYGDAAVPSLTLRRCVFDSTWMGVRNFRVANLEECRFYSSFVGSVVAHSQGTINARHCYFDIEEGGGVWTRVGGSFVKCSFESRGTGVILRGTGNSLLIDSCHFSGSNDSLWTAIHMRPRQGSILRNCEFTGLHTTDAIVIITDSCNNQPKGSEFSVRVLNNRFVNCGSGRGALQQGGEMVHVQCSDGVSGFLARIDSNVVDSTDEIHGWATGFYLQASASVKRNYFGRIHVDEKPQSYVRCDSGTDSVFYRYNSFTQALPGIAREHDEETFVDATSNWWGHASGPYHSTNNPVGQGASVDDNIRFNPWLQDDPDTTHHGGGDTSEFVSPTPDELFPDDFTLVAYPNPFNAVTTLVIEVARGGEYEVLLYDVTGRVAATVFSGRIENSRRVVVDAAGLASGVYFAQLRGGDAVLAVGKVLLIR